MTVCRRGFSPSVSSFNLLQDVHGNPQLFLITLKAHCFNTSDTTTPQLERTSSSPLSLALLTHFYPAPSSNYHLMTRKFNCPSIANVINSSCSCYESRIRQFQTKEVLDQQDFEILWTVAYDIVWYSTTENQTSKILDFWSNHWFIEGPGLEISL